MKNKVKTIIIISLIMAMLVPCTAFAATQSSIRKGSFGELLGRTDDEVISWAQANGYVFEADNDKLTITVTAPDPLNTYDDAPAQAIKDAKKAAKEEAKKAVSLENFLEGARNAKEDKEGKKHPILSGIGNIAKKAAEGYVKGAGKSVVESALEMEDAKNNAPYYKNLYITYIFKCKYDDSLENLRVYGLYKFEPIKNRQPQNCINGASYITLKQDLKDHDYDLYQSSSFYLLGPSKSPDAPDYYVSVYYDRSDERVNDLLNDFVKRFP